MGVDYIARKSAKKRKKKERQAVGKDGIGRRERRRKKVRRLCQGVCYKAPELTEEDKRWSDGDDDDAGAPDSDIEEAAARAISHQGASTSGAAATKQPQPNPKSQQQKGNNKRKRSQDGQDGKAKVLSTSVQLLDPAVLAENARKAALRKLPAGAKADALERFPPLLQACMLSQHHVEPTPVQERCWPPALAGRDVQGVAEPGSGKTLAFLLPGLVRLQAEGHTAATKAEGPAMLVVLPTRELAQQVAAQCRNTRAVTGLRTVCVFGGSPREEQAALLAEKQPHVLVATPGRLLDLVDGGELRLQGRVRYLVLDEADKMLSLGFKPQLDRLYDMLLKPYDESESRAVAKAKAAAATVEDGAAKKAGKKKAKSKAQQEQHQEPQQQEAPLQADGAAAQAGGAGARPQVLLFSATMPSEVTAAAAQWLRRPEVVEVSSGGANAISRTITQVVHVCAEHKKPEKLLKHLSRIRESTPAGYRNVPRVLVFANRVKTVRFLATSLAKEGYKAAQLHGQRSQAERTQAVSDFRSGKTQVLVATDVAARGLDIRALPYVVNYDFPARLETYVHRVGRTGRLAAFGHAYSFFTRNLAPLAPPLLALLQAHEQAVDPNLAALASAWKMAEERLGGAAAAATAAAAVRKGDDGGVAAGDGGGDEDNGDVDDDEGDAAAAASEGDGPSLAEEVLGAAEDLLEGLGPRDARAIAALMRKKLSKKAAPTASAGQEAAGGAGGDDAGGERGKERVGKKQRREGDAQGAQPGLGGGEAAGGAVRKSRPGDEQLVPTTREQRHALEKQQQQQRGVGARGAAFVASKKFNGRMPGYVFKRGALGMGYYLDEPPRTPAAAAAEAAAALKAKVGAAAKAAAANAAATSGKGGGAAEKGKAAATAAVPAAKAAGSGKATSTAAAAAWGLPTRNKPIIPVRHSDFLSDSDEGDENGQCGGSDSDADSDPPTKAGRQRQEQAQKRSAKASDKVAAAAFDEDDSAEEDDDGRDGGRGFPVVQGGDSDDDDQSDDLPEGGLRAAAKKKHRALPGRLRKKLAKLKGKVPAQEQGRGQSNGAGQMAAAGKQRQHARPAQGGKAKPRGR